jgi:hypothetical protein
MSHGRESDPPSVGDGRFCTGFSDPDFRPTIRAISPRQNQELPTFNKNFPNQIFSQTKAVNFLEQFFTRTKTVTFFLIHEKLVSRTHLFDIVSSCSKDRRWYSINSSD